MVVVGSMSMDLTAQAPRLPTVGETVLGTRFTMVPGGKGNNQAIAAARQGVSTAMVGCLGDDAFNGPVRDLLAAAGVDTTHVLTLPHQASGVAHIMVDGSGRNIIITVPLANGRLSPVEIAAAGPLLRSAGVVLTQLEIPLDAVGAALATARSHRVRTILNPAPAAELGDEMLSLVDICVPNEAEAEALTGEDVSSVEGATRAARALLGRGCGSAVITLGERGCLYADRQRVLEVASIQVDTVDTVAAGDAFCGALAAWLATGLTVEEALARASAAGALATTVPGATPSLPTWEATRELLLRAGPPTVRGRPA
ncbi:MAG: ribokinase [Candidatus Dormibacteria bacterium]